MKVSVQDDGKHALLLNVCVRIRHVENVIYSYILYTREFYNFLCIPIQEYKSTHVSNEFVTHP